jgi:cell division protein FtsQ
MKEIILANQKPIFKKSKKEKIKYSVLILILIVFVVITLNIIVEFLITAKIFNLKYIDIKGNNLVSNKSIIKKLQLPSSNLFMLDTSLAMEKIKQIRFIEKAFFKKSFPNTLLISIVERIPSALLLFKNKLYYVDDTGTIISGYKSKYVKKLTNKFDYPIITGIDDNFGTEERSNYISLALSLINKLANSVYFKNNYISEVLVDKLQGLSVITTGNPIPIVFGFDSFEDKAFYLSYVLDDLEKNKKKFCEINLNFDKKVVVKLKR